MDTQAWKFGLVLGFSLGIWFRIIGIPLARYSWTTSAASAGDESQPGESATHDVVI